MAKAKDQRHVLGIRGEKFARKYLVRQGCKFVAANVSTDQGEVDLIMFDRGTLVFVEVKTRSDESFASGEDAVTPEKRRHIQSLVRYFVTVNHLQNFPCRFDIIAVTTTGRNEFDVRHQPNAFTLQTN
jgi:putative endonuclease